jgi:hypothetical protein
MKICNKCKEIKEESEFNKNSSKKDKLQTRCKPCDRIHAKLVYDKDPLGKEKAVLRNKRNIKNNQNLMFSYLQDKQCKDCNESDILVLEFDHRDPKFKQGSISELISSGLTWNKILKEIDKCDIVCANCHRKRTMKQFGWYKFVLEAQKVERLVEAQKVMSSILI